MRWPSIFLAIVTLTGCNPAETMTEEDAGDSGATASAGASAASATSEGEETTTGEGATTGASDGGTTATLPATSTGAETTDGTTTTTSATTSTTSTTSGGPATATSTTSTTSTTSGGTTSGGTTTGEGTTTTGVEPWAPKACPGIYAQELLPTFHLELTQDVLDSLEKEWLAADEDKTQYYPVKEFRYEDIVVTDAMIRLRGNDKWWYQQGKMQWAISFNKNDKKGKFQGVKHLLFDCARYNESFLRDRLSLQILRDVGVQAPCANNAKLMVNGEYYGLFTNLEKVDSEFLERYYEFPDANLYKRYEWEKTTNEEDPDESDLDALLKANSIGELEAVMDLEQAVLEWATEALLPNGDGAWAGGLNFYVYNDPLSGFHVIPWDLDATFTRLEYNTDPYYLKPNDHGRPFFDLAVGDPYWNERYVESLAFALAVGYDVEVLQARIDAWSAQIADAVADDHNKPFSTSAHKGAVKDLREFVADRAAYIEDWLK